MKTSFLFPGILQSNPLTSNATSKAGSTTSITWGASTLRISGSLRSQHSTCTRATGRNCLCQMPSKALETKIFSLHDRCLPFALDQFQEIADRPMRLDRMAKADVVDDAIAVSATDTFTLDEAAFFQILDDPLNGSLRDADLHGHFTEHRRFVLVEQDKDMRMVRQEGPSLPGSWLFRVRLAEVASPRSHHFTARFCLAWQSFGHSG